MLEALKSSDKDKEGKYARSESPSKLATLTISVLGPSAATRNYSVSSGSDSSVEQHHTMPRGPALPLCRCVFSPNSS